ncbi:MAG: hypothetical protein JW832_01845 [Deltaproteobacteria bacterium]|nr:hypothetical protein [Deltaproteobacteria bacterium]
MFDILIQGGTDIDGTGAAAQRCDVGITGDTITAVGVLQAAQARRTRGLSAAFPGCCENMCLSRNCSALKMRCIK